ncbi:MAG: DUF4867 family protein [Planctomycetia bacterium]|nr:DUF4867 family protein [Planctomycetia bacterium]
MAEQMKIYRVTDPEFARYGCVVKADVQDVVDAAASLKMPLEGAKYEPSIALLEATYARTFFQDEIYGELPIQIGCCWGHNRQLNALEWHKSSEINIAVTDFVLMLAKLDEIHDGRLNSADVKAFEVKKGETVEVYADTLHFCPCTTDPAGFNCIVVLPKETNLPLDGKPADPLLFRKNKWLICHEENEALKIRGVVPGIFGENHTL